MPGPVQLWPLRRGAADDRHSSLETCVHVLAVEQVQHHPWPSWNARQLDNRVSNCGTLLTDADVELSWQPSQGASNLMLLPRPPQEESELGNEQHGGGCCGRCLQSLLARDRVNLFRVPPESWNPALRIPHPLPSATSRRLPLKPLENATSDSFQGDSLLGRLGILSSYPRRRSSCAVSEPAETAWPSGGLPSA